MFRTCLFLCLLAGSYQVNINEFVVPESAEVGSDVTLKCGFEVDAGDGKAVPYVKWWFIPRYGADDNRVQLYQQIRPDIAPELRHGIESAGTYDIVVKNVTHMETGKYECEVSGSGERRINQSLTVFSKGSGPQLNISEVRDGADADDEEDLLLECHADAVTPQPELVIYANGRPVDGVTQYVSNVDDGLFKVSANVTVTKANMLGALVKCELSYTDHNVPHPPFVDEETYNSGLPPSTTGPPPTPIKLWQNDNRTETQQNPNRSGLGVVSCWLTVAAMLILLQLRPLI